jgi:chemotaxis family two-component system response regulator Rcp1
MDIPAPRRPLTILLVEDNPVDVAIIRRVLDTHALSYHLHVITNGENALHFFDHLAQDEHGTPPDILLLDLTLPRVSGGEVLQRIKALPACARMRIVILTGYADLYAPEKAGTLVADAFFVKPSTFPAFMRLGNIIKTLSVGNTPEGAER